MYIRWKRRKLSTRPWEAPAYSLYAVLVEAHRVDGKPRQRVVRHLGYIREYALTEGLLAHNLTFWKKVDKNLDELELPGDTVARIEQSLSSKVRRPTQEESTQVEAELAQFRQTLQALASRYGGRRLRRKPKEVVPTKITTE